MRTPYYSYITNDNPPKVIHFNKHFSRLAAEKHYGDVSRLYRGNSSTDYSVTIYQGREEFEKALGKDYEIDYKKKTLTLRRK